MPSQPLQPFSPPAILLPYLSGGLSGGTAVMWLLITVFVFWSIYTLIAVYHWLKYSHASWVAFPAIIAHLFVSFSLAVYTLSGTGLFSAYLP